VVNDLEMPEAFAAGSVKREKGVGEEVRAFARASVEIRLGSFRGDVNDAPLLIERLPGPRHNARGCFVGLRRPGVVADFSRSRDEVEDPTEFPGAHIEGADSAGPPNAAEDEEIFVNHPRCVQADSRRWAIAEAGSEVNGAVRSEAADGFAVRR